MKAGNSSDSSLAKDAIDCATEWVARQKGKWSLDDVVQLLRKQSGAAEVIDERPLMMIVRFSDSSGVGVHREGLDLLDPTSSPSGKEVSRIQKNSMQILTNLNADSDDVLEEHRPTDASEEWELVASGFWSEDMYHSGHIAYYIRSPEPGTWVLDSVSRNAELDGVTQEDVEEGNLNDDQMQAMWGMSLEEAQNQEYRRIAAFAEGVDANAKAKEVAQSMYDQIRKAGGKVIDEPDCDGLLEI